MTYCIEEALLDGYTLDVLMLPGVARRLDCCYCCRVYYLLISPPPTIIDYDYGVVVAGFACALIIGFMD